MQCHWIHSMLLRQQPYLMLEHSNLFQSRPSTLSRGSPVCLHPTPSLLMTSDLHLGRFWASNSVSQPMRVERHIYIHKYTHIQIHTYTHRDIYKYINTYIYTDRLTYKHIQKYMHMLTDTDTYICTYKYTHTRTHQTSDLSFWTLERITKLCSESNNCPKDHQMSPLFPMIWVRDPLLTWSGNWKWFLHLQVPITRATRRPLPFTLTCPSTFRRTTNS